VLFDDIPGKINLTAAKSQSLPEMRVQRNPSSIVTPAESGPSLDLELIMPLIEKYKNSKGNLILMLIRITMTPSFWL
jgi:hypothetical protein